MEAPVCRLCGAKHWGSEHRWPDTKPVKMDKPKVVAKADTPVTPVQGFDRTAYQREYMRQRRANARKGK